MFCYKKAKDIYLKHLFASHKQLGVFDKEFASITKKII